MEKETLIPQAKEIPHELIMHNHKRIDPYFWLRERENPETIAYLESENAYREKQTAHIKGFEEDLFQVIFFLCYIGF